MFKMVSVKNGAGLVLGTEPKKPLDPALQKTVLFESPSLPGNAGKYDCASAKIGLPIPNISKIS